MCSLRITIKLYKSLIRYLPVHLKYLNKKFPFFLYKGAGLLKKMQIQNKKNNPPSNPNVKKQPNNPQVKILTCIQLAHYAAQMAVRDVQIKPLEVLTSNPQIHQRKIRMLRNPELFPNIADYI